MAHPKNSATVKSNKDPLKQRGIWVLPSHTIISNGVTRIKGSKQLIKTLYENIKKAIDS